MVRGSDKAERKIIEQIQDVLPGAIIGPGGINLDSISEQSATIGLIALVGLVVSGTGWIAAMRGSLRKMWGAEDLKVNFAVAKVTTSLVGNVLQALRGCVLISGDTDRPAWVGNAR